MLLRADKSWVEAERLTDSSCMQRWVASAGFTLLAFACLQLAWCSCQPVIDEYHHLKCKRKRLCEGRHDELPPAGALWDTLGAPPSSLSRFFFFFFLPSLLVSTSLASLSIPLSFSPFMLIYLRPLFYFLPFLSLGAPPSPSYLLRRPSHFCPLVLFLSPSLPPWFPIPSCFYSALFNKLLSSPVKIPFSFPLFHPLDFFMSVCWIDKCMLISTDSVQHSNIS